MGPKRGFGAQHMCGGGATFEFHEGDGHCLLPLLFGNFMIRNTMI